jgi:hypothetical protein
LPEGLTATLWTDEVWPFSRFSGCRRSDFVQSNLEHQEISIITQCSHIRATLFKGKEHHYGTHMELKVKLKSTPSNDGSN